MDKKEQTVHPLPYMVRATPYKFNQYQSFTPVAKYLIGPEHAGPDNTGTKKLENKDGLFFYFQKRDFLRK